MRIEQRDWLTVAFITLVSLAVRLMVVAGAPLPLNDGGLFYAFTNDLLANGLRLPAYSSYNAAGIPLVYPPLAFYLTAVLHLVSGTSVLHLLQYVPAVVSAAAIPVFFVLASKLLASGAQALLASMAFSALPRTFDWLIMGGGITRSLGLLFSLLFLVQVVSLFRRNERKAILPAVVFGGLLVLSHPEATIHTAIAACALLVWYQRNRVGVARGLVVVVGIAILTSPWWLLVLARHSVDPWLAALKAAHQDSYNPLLGLIAMLRFDFTDEPFIRLFGVLGLLGLFLQVSRREYLLPAWLVLVQLVEPRGGALYLMIPLAMSAGCFLEAVLLPALGTGKASRRASRPRRAAEDSSTPAIWQRNGIPAVVLGFLFLYGTGCAYVVGMRIRQDATLEWRDLHALEWVSSNTSAEARFALITGGDPLLDPTSDWFPAITGRRSVATVFGTEWIRELDFASGLDRYRALQACVDHSSSCIKNWEYAGSETLNYVYVRVEGVDNSTTLLTSLVLDPDFRLAYSENGIAVFESAADSAD